MTFVFDMDGTIADLYSVENWLAKLRASDASPYREARPMHDFGKLVEMLRALESYGVNIAIVSWLSKDSNKAYDKAVREAKRAWLVENEFPFDEIHLVKYGTRKQNTLRDSSNAILFDDNDEIRAGWTAGEAIHPDNMIEYIEQIYNSFMEN